MNAHELLHEALGYIAHRPECYIFRDRSVGANCDCGAAHLSTRITSFLNNEGRRTP